MSAKRAISLLFIVKIVVALTSVNMKVRELR